MVFHNKLRGASATSLLCLAYISSSFAADGPPLDRSGAPVTEPFSDAEMELVFAEIGAVENDPNYITIFGSYTVRNGKRQGDTVLIIKKPIFLDRLCVVEPKLFNVRITETELKIYRDNVWNQRFVALMDSNDECLSITERTMYQKLLAAPDSAELTVVREILESEDSLNAAVAEFAGMSMEDSRSELRIGQIVDAEGNVDNADYCAIVFRDDVMRPFQVCVNSDRSQLVVQSVGEYFDKYGTYDD